MKNIPEELIYVLIFGAILAVQYLMKRFGPQPQPAEALHQILDEQDGGKEQRIEQFCGDTVHRCPRYGFALAAGSAPLPAISWRITVSACRFFMR